MGVGAVERDREKKRGFQSKDFEHALRRWKERSESRERQRRKKIDRLAFSSEVSFSL